MEDLNLFVNALFALFTQIFNLYTTTFVLSGVLALWLLRKVYNLYRRL